MIAREVSFTSFTGPRTEGLSLLRTGDEDETLEFLRARPAHTVIMGSFIRDNGLVSHLNRGAFHAYRNFEGRLEGVALVGHITMFEVRNDAALQAFASLARGYHNTHLIMAEQHLSKRFWKYFERPGHAPRCIRHELLFEQHRRLVHQVVDIHQSANGLRLASCEDLELVMRTHVQMAVEEFGLDDPLRADPEGFRLRYARRIEQGRVWVVTEDGDLIFKADVVAETPEAIYLEGIYVRPDRRGQGRGSRCLSALTRDLLRRNKVVCLFVNADNQPAQTFYLRAGYSWKSSYTTIFV